MIKDVLKNNCKNKYLSEILYLLNGVLLVILVSNILFPINISTNLENFITWDGKYLIKHKMPKCGILILLFPWVLQIILNVIDKKTDSNKVKVHLMSFIDIADLVSAVLSLISLVTLIFYYEQTNDLPHSFLEKVYYLEIMFHIFLSFYNHFYWKNIEIIRKCNIQKSP